ncbi:telomerase Cajal body protein 1 homolog [Anticarsia gemmatalis]|uniref:telomerase Cajal body protein 1 homolog n=1 Tax=Anticarsia gemmatalis TaxID=129554 RepID=UPI003F759851
MEDISVESDFVGTGTHVGYYSSTEATSDMSEIKENELAHGANVQQIQYPSLFTSKTLLELSNSSWSRSAKAKEDLQPYLRGCKWSPDGTCCLTVVNNDGMHITELPTELYSGNVASNRMINILDSIIHVKESGLIYDYCWYPHMNSAVPESCCWITTIQNGPIQMWDAFNGSLRCTYRGYDDVDELEPAISLTFTQDAKKIVAGYKKSIRTFDVQRPGRDYSEHKIYSPASCLATSDNLLAVGSWSTTISLYNINEMGAYKSIGKMHGHSSGVTHLKFAPDGLKLVSGARKDHRLLVWDIRYYRKPLNILTRAANTNQRVYFDISPCGKYLVSGGTDGIVKVWDQDHVDWMSSIDVSDVDNDNATYKFKLHNDCCNGVSIHPCRPILATGSGQYHFVDPIKSLEDSNENINTLGQDNKTFEQDSKTFEQDNKTLGEDNKTLGQYNKRIKKERQCNMSGDDSSSYSTDEEIRNARFNYKSTMYDRNLPKCEQIRDIDVRYSSISENCLVFWWIGDVET